MMRGTLGPIALAALLLATGSATAQFRPPPPGQTTLINIRSGFMPDPQLLRGAMGGPVPATQINSNCRGTISQAPNHIVRSPTGFRGIRFVVNAPRDSTLIVMLPNGAVLCDDDGGEGNNPLVETQSPPGDIRIWIGAYSASDQSTPYMLGVTELAHITANNLTAPPGPPPGPPGPPPGGLAPNAPPAFGTLNLRTGFMPDPQVIAGHAGGPVEAQQFNPNCRGYVTPQPSHVLVSQTGFRSLRILGRGSLDTTLVVMLPNGQFVCDDDGGDGSDPLLAFSTPPGAIRVWVGAYSAGSSGAYNIAFTEHPHIGTANIPMPGGRPPGPIVTQPPRPPPPPPTPAPTVVEMQLSIPVTLIGPGMDGNTVALWRPSGGTPTQITLSGRVLSAGGVTIATLPDRMSAPVVTVMQVRGGNVIIRAEQAPFERRDPGAQAIFLVGWAGQPAVRNQWAGRYGQRGPRWAR